VSGLTPIEIFAIVLVVILCAVMAGVGLLLLQGLRRRRDQLRGELSGKPEAIGDRAFNRIAMARREADLLASQGAEVPRARELIGEAQAAFDGRQFDRAYEIAQSAHETLVAARQRPPSASRPIAPAASGETREAPPAPGSATAPPEAAAPPAPKLPAHRAESQFQLRLLEEDLARAQSDRANDGRTLRAKALSVQAQQAFDRSDYAEAFRLALKGRREAGGAVETLAPPPTRPKGAGGPGPAAGAPEGASDAALAAAAVASADRCPDCGHPMTAGDAFCRGCGTPRKGATCAQCGAERTPADTFCGRCGASFA